MLRNKMRLNKVLRTLWKKVCLSTAACTTEFISVISWHTDDSRQYSIWIESGYRLLASPIRA